MLISLKNEKNNLLTLLTVLFVFRIHLLFYKVNGIKLISILRKTDLLYKQLGATEYYVLKDIF